MTTPNYVTRAELQEALQQLRADLRADVRADVRADRQEDLKPIADGVKTLVDGNWGQGTRIEALESWASRHDADNFVPAGT